LSQGQKLLWSPQDCLADVDTGQSCSLEPQLQALDVLLLLLPRGCAAAVVQEVIDS
jgi:hypothetical protein